MTPRHWVTLSLLSAFLPNMVLMRTMSWNVTQRYCFTSPGFRPCSSSWRMVSSFTPQQSHRLLPRLPLLPKLLLCCRPARRRKMSEPTHRELMHAPTIRPVYCDLRSRSWISVLIATITALELDEHAALEMRPACQSQSDGNVDNRPDRSLCRNVDQHVSEHCRSPDIDRIAQGARSGR